jgi:hypothetical protein
VAKRLRITVKRVAKLERAGLRQLRASCGAPAETAAETMATVSTVSTPGAPATRSTRTASSPAKPAAHRPGAKPTPTPATGDVAGETATNLVRPGQADHGIGLLIPLALLAIAAVGFLVGRRA